MNRRRVHMFFRKSHVKRIKEVSDQMTYEDIYNNALEKLNINAELVEDYRPASELFIPELKRQIPKAIIIWLKDKSKIIYIESEA